jgi:hypothetical protein
VGGADGEECWAGSVVNHGLVVIRRGLDREESEEDGEDDGGSDEYKRKKENR